MNSKPNVAIIDYGAGNQESVKKAFEYIGAKAHVIKRPESMKRFSHIVLPGVGSFYRSINYMRELDWDECIIDNAKSGKPILGICLGMQLLLSKGTEDGISFGLDIVPGEVKRFSFDPSLERLTIPHVGFDTVYLKNNSLLFKNLPNELDFYFTHSYIANCVDSYVSGETIHGERFVSAIEKENVVGTQFHPEKSQSNGLKVLKNFLDNFDA
tara:strand:- start:174 stop:809 length:636 start_codon:yes stop_codon:yes gene_type:complete